MEQIVVIGAGFAGLWSALAAARKLEDLGIDPCHARITVINRDTWHSIRVRNYESELDQIRVPLDLVLPPVGIALKVGEVTGIEAKARSVLVTTSAGVEEVKYSRLIIASGSRISLPKLPGLEQHVLNIDTFAGAEKLDKHLNSLLIKPATIDRDTVLVIGAGLTGIELACELPNRLRGMGIKAPNVILADRLPHIGSDMGGEARLVIDRALRTIGIETQTNINIATCDNRGVTLTDGKRIDAQTVVWCGGLNASPVSKLLMSKLDHLGRLPVDRFMRLKTSKEIYAAGDVATAMVDDRHSSVMSCQHARPMGRFAGNNAVASLFGQKQLPLEIPWYSTCLDLGPQGAVQTQGWERSVLLSGAEAKNVKQTINCVRIYPPVTGERSKLLEAAEPTVQAPPTE